ncbi:NADPH-dependent methylglyoxal reductase Gre2p [Monosporozyma unispora]|nr:methylglyoxal reductase (NADPH-dependent) gre2 [Kazachstania unispora]
MSVLISGCFGFIAKHIIHDLLDQKYKIIGTVRSQEEREKLYKQFGNNSNLTLEIVEDIRKEHAFDDVFKKHSQEIKYVLHTASPYDLETTKFTEELYKPAVFGTRAILNAIEKYGSDTVERFVHTSSYAAIMDFETERVEGTVYTENSWNPDNWDQAQECASRAYNGSKVLAEKEVWNFVKEKEGKVKFKVTTINPGYVLGPQTFDEDISKKLNTSCEIINKLIHTDPSSEINPSEIYGCFVNVLDVSKAHILAFQRDELIGKRLLMSEGRFSTQDVLDVLNEDFSVLKGKIPIGYPGTGAMHHNIGATVDNSETHRLLNFKFKSFKETIDETAEQILRVENRQGH